jgi:hypothetical protein
MNARRPGRRRIDKGATMYCEACGAEAETRHVTFYQNIGALVIRFSNTVDGHLCKSCIHGYFWSMTTVNLLLGWWGVISFLLNPFFILNNVIRYLGCLGMKPPGKAAGGHQDGRPTHRVPASEECYLCGRPLRPEERASRVCKDCS